MTALHILVGGTGLTETYEETWQTIGSEVGSASFTMLHTDTQRSLLTDKTRVTFMLDSTEIGCFVVSDIEDTWIGEDEEAVEASKYTCLSAETDLDDAVVYPATGVRDVVTPIFTGKISTKPYSTERYAGPMDPNYSDTGWGSANEAAPPFGALSPIGWDDDDAMWIGALSETGDLFHFRHTFTTSGILALTIKWAVQNYGELWLDDVCLDRLDPAVDENVANQTRKIIVEVTDGEHTIYARVQRIGVPDVLLLCTAYARGTTTNVFRTSSAWKASSTLNEQQTPGELVLQLISEAQARGTITGMTCTFDAVNDSRGVAWPLLIGQHPMRVGDDSILTVLKALTEGYVEFAMLPDGSGGNTLSMWVAAGVDGAPGRGNALGLTFTKGVNCRDLREKRTS